MAHLGSVWAAFGVAADAAALDAGTADALPARLLRTSDHLTHPVFHEHRSETSLMRWLRRLADADLALDRTMIPLGSCTMKLNAAAEMEPISWPEFADLHPFAPRDDVAGSLSNDRGPGALARGADRLRRGVAAAERGQPGRAGGAAGDRRLPPVAGRGAPRRVPDPGERARHERGVGGHGGHAGRGRRDLGAGRRRPRRPAGEGRGAPRHPRRADDHLSVDARGVRGRGRRGVRGRARGGRPGLRRRGEPERAARAGPAGGVRGRRVAPEPAQDVLHPARRRRPRRRAGRGGRAPRAVPAGRRGRRRRARRRGVGGAVRQPRRAADLVDVRADDGVRRAAAGDADGRGGGELRRAPAAGALPGPLRGP